MSRYNTTSVTHVTHQWKKFPNIFATCQKVRVADMSTYAVIMEAQMMVTSQEHGLRTKEREEPTLLLCLQAFLRIEFTEKEEEVRQRILMQYENVTSEVGLKNSCPSILHENPLPMLFFPSDTSDTKSRIYAKFKMLALHVFGFGNHAPSNHCSHSHYYCMWRNFDSHFLNHWSVDLGTSSIADSNKKCHRYSL